MYYAVHWLVVPGWLCLAGCAWLVAKVKSM